MTHAMEFNNKKELLIYGTTLKNLKIITLSEDRQNPPLQKEIEYVLHNSI